MSALASNIPTSIKKAIVVVTTNRTELAALERACRALYDKSVHLVFIRPGRDAAVATRELGNELKDLGLLRLASKVLGSASKSITELLKDNGYVIRFFLGENPELLDKNYSQREAIAEKTESVKVRYACVCRKCESIISERFFNITPLMAKDYKHPDGSETAWDNYNQRFNVVNEENTCHLCG